MIPCSVKDLDDNENKCLKNGYHLIETIDKRMNDFQISKCLEDIFNYIDELNKFMDSSQPWNTFKKNQKKAGIDLSVLIECFRIIGIILQPFIPNAAKNILDTLNISDSERKFKNLSIKFAIDKNHTIKNPEQLFPRYEK